MNEWWRRLRGWATERRRISGELDEEMRSHFEMEVEDGVERGMTPAEARMAARRRFGNAAAVGERAREAWGFPSLDSFLGDVRYGVRALGRSPGFALIVILTFALGVGVNTAVFGVVRSVLLKPLPYPDSERMVWFGESAGKAEGISVTWGNYNAWRAGNHTFDDMAAFQFTERTLTGRGEPVVTRGMTVTASYFPLLGMRPLMGRLFGAAEDRAGGPPVIVLSHRFWSGVLGGDPHVVGSTVTLNGNAFEVIGVAAPLWEPWRADYYLPLSGIAGNPADRRQHGSIRMLGRLKAGTTLAAARADLDAILRHLAEIDPGPENEHRSFGRYFAEYATGNVRGTLEVLMGAAGLILLIACANVASLLLARNTARASELALRKAIGAGRIRLVRQLLTETTVIAAAGGLAGVAMAYATLRVVIAVAPENIPRLAEASLDLPVLLFACVVSVAAGVLAGLAPVIVAGNPDLTAVMKEGGRGGAGVGRGRQLFRNALVMSEVALTFMLAFGSGILVRSLVAAQHASPGFDARNVVSFSLELPGRSYRGTEAVSQFYERLLGDLRAVPGVEGASAVHCPPGAGDCGDWFYSIPGRPEPSRTEVPVALFNTAEAGYFRTLGIPMRQGREFNDGDRAGGREVAVVNETFARKWWGGASAVGQQIKVGGPYQKGGLLEIVGVAGDVRQFGLDSEPAPEIYLPFSQGPSSGMAIVVRTAGDPGPAMAAVRSRVAAIDRNLPLQRFGRMEQALGAGLARRRFTTMLLTLFAALGMALAGIGIYGLLSYWVTSREAEIAVRLALGARPAMILRWTGAQGVRLAAVGVLVGAAGAWAGARVLEDLVFGVAARNGATMVAAAAVVVCVAAAATAVPAWRAARVDAARRLHCS